ncbi:hypothetical protein BaRGS_00024190 [Batillaria attramentaria]|uniref:Uncharacterized protein n=1 Tax=Batillaria attramentaria TaxID=370345 RepID=A0ABD0KBT2_9CAEN
MKRKLQEAERSVLTGPDVITRSWGHNTSNITLHGAHQKLAFSYGPRAATLAEPGQLALVHSTQDRPGRPAS